MYLLTQVTKFKLMSYQLNLVLNEGEPPYVTLQKLSETRIIAGGTSVTLKCPVDGADGQVLYRWYKVGQF